MSKTRFISICWDDIKAQGQEGHSAFSRSTKNGKIYVNLRVIDKEKDQYGKDVAILLNPTKEKKETEDGHFVGNGVQYTSENQNSSENPIIPEGEDDLPF